MGSFDTLSNSNGITQTSYSYSGPPPQYNGSPHQYDPQQHISPPHNYRPAQQQQPTVQFARYTPPPRHHNGQRPQHNGPPPYFNSHEDNSHIHHVHPQRLSDRISHHASSYPTVSQSQFHQDIRRSPQKQVPVQSTGKTIYGKRSQDYHDGRYNGRNKGIFWSSFP